MKKYSIVLILIALFAQVENLSAQQKNSNSENGFWVLESNIHDKKNTTVRFYDNNSTLMYEEKVCNCRLNIKRKKNIQYLREGLEKAYVAYNSNQKVIRDATWMTAMINKKR